MTPQLNSDKKSALISATVTKTVKSGPKDETVKSSPKAVKSKKLKRSLENMDDKLESAQVLNANEVVNMVVDVIEDVIVSTEVQSEVIVEEIKKKTQTKKAKKTQDNVAVETVILSGSIQSPISGGSSDLVNVKTKKSKKSAVVKSDVPRKLHAYNVFVKAFAESWKGEKKEMMKEAGVAWQKTKSKIAL